MGFRLDDYNGLVLFNLISSVPAEVIRFDLSWHHLLVYGLLNHLPFGGKALVKSPRSVQGYLEAVVFEILLDFLCWGRGLVVNVISDVIRVIARICRLPIVHVVFLLVIRLVVVSLVIFVTIFSIFFVLPILLVSRGSFISGLGIPRIRVGEGDAVVGSELPPVLLIIEVGDFLRSAASGEHRIL